MRKDHYQIMDFLHQIKDCQIRTSIFKKLQATEHDTALDTR